jgi:hypothetical protein
MSRTVIRNGLTDGEFHGVAFYDEFRDEDRTYEFIEKIESGIDTLKTDGMAEIRRIAGQFRINDINLIKPGIGEATRVLLRRLPNIILVAENAEDKYIAHIIQLAKEKGVPVESYPLVRYKACGIIKELSADA